MVLRSHWLVSGLLAAGLALRVLAQVAYHPALIYVDTLKNLYGVYPGADPLGYRVLLKLILLVGDLGTVAAIQHVLGLAMGVTLYAVLLRRGVPRWLAAVAAAPVLLDAYQLQMGQTVMPDVWFEAVMVAGLTVLLWRPAATAPWRSRRAWPSGRRRPFVSSVRFWSCPRCSTCWRPVQAGTGPSACRPR